MRKGTRIIKNILKHCHTKSGFCHVDEYLTSLYKNETNQNKMSNLSILIKTVGHTTIKHTDIPLWSK